MDPSDERTQITLEQIDGVQPVFPETVAILLL